nr:MAG TPA: hypothetical protein [Caudoviricetes sp.]
MSRKRQAIVLPNRETVQPLHLHQAFMCRCLALP